MSVSMWNGFPKKYDEEGLPQRPRDLLKPSAQLSEYLCPIIKPFSPNGIAVCYFRARNDL